MAKYEEKLKAHNLRRQGKSVGDIARQLSVSKGTVSLWCRNLMLTREQQERLRVKGISAGHRGRMRGAEANRKKKTDAIKEAESWAQSKIDGLNRKDLLVICAALYWAEGSKTRGQFSFTNSDPIMARLMVDCLRYVMGLSNEDFMPRVAINSIHEPRIDVVERFWSRTLNIPRKQFRRTTLIKTNLKKIYANHDNYYGMIVIRFRNSTMIKYRLLASIAVIQEQYPRRRSSAG